MDERSKSIGLKAMGITLVIAYLYVLFACIWKYISTKDIMNSSWEIGLLVLIPFSILWFGRSDESIMLPKTIQGIELPTKLNSVAKSRRKKHYALSALGYSTGFTIFTFIALFLVDKDYEYLIFLPNLSHTMNYILMFIFEIIIGFITFYLISYIWIEHIIKRYNRTLAELEDEDE